MPLTSFPADAFGAVTVALVSLLTILGLFCIYRALYFQIRILRRDFLELLYFNGPWVTRIALVLVAIWWSVWEILRLTFLNEKLTLLSSVCKLYILSNLGFAEPTMFLILVFLLRASLQKRGSGALSKRWNKKVVLYVVLLSLPVLIMQLGLVLLGPKYEKINKRYVETSYVVEGSRVCTYPLFGTGFIGIFDLLLIMYTIYIGRRLVFIVINKGLRRRVYWLISSIFLVLPLRVSLLVLTAFMHPGSWAFEAVVFLAFCVLFFVAGVGICVLVYYPFADSLVALRNLGQVEMQEMVPYDDYYRVAEVGGSSNCETKRGSISFRTMIREDTPV